MIVGIDPGATGAIAWLSDSGFLVEVRDLPVGKEYGRTRLMSAVLAAMLREAGRMPIHAFVEQVGPGPEGGRAALFSFGRNFGQIEGVLSGCGVPMTLLTPQRWKRALRLPADKGEARFRAAQLWPGLAGAFARVKDDGRAEAALIGLYGSGLMHGVGSAAA